MYISLFILIKYRGEHFHHNSLILPLQLFQSNCESQSKPQRSSVGIRKTSAERVRCFLDPLMEYCMAAIQNSQKPLQLGKVLLQPVLDKALEEEVEVLHPATHLLPPLFILRCSHIGQSLISKYNNQLLRTQFESEIFHGGTEQVFSFGVTL